MSSTFPRAAGPPASKQPQILNNPPPDLTLAIRGFPSSTEKQPIQYAFTFC